MADKKGLIGEFKEFIMRGNVMDMAVGVIIGGAFGGIISSLVEDILTPIIGMLGGNPDFSSIKIGGGIMIGNFINAVLNFVLIGLCMFLVVKAFNKAKSVTEKPAEEEAVWFSLMAEKASEVLNIPVSHIIKKERRQHRRT